MTHWLGGLLAHHGYHVVFVALFLNNCCLPVPGDTTLLGAGILVGKGTLSFWGVVVFGTMGCFLGATAAYWLGFRYGRRFLTQNRWLRISPKRMGQVEAFFEAHGPKAVFFARFVALLHPVTGLLAGAAKTPLRPFLFYNLAGSFGYAVLYTLVGHFFGQRWELFKGWLGPIALYLLLVAAALAVLGLFLRRAIVAFLSGFFPGKKDVQDHEKSDS